MWGRELSKVRKTAGQLKHEQHEGTALDTGNAQVCVCTKKEYQFQNIIVLFLLEIKNYFSFNIMYIYIFEYIMRTNYLDQILCDFYLSNNFFFLLDFSFLVVSIFFVSDYLCILRYTSISLVLFLHNIWSFLFTTCDSLAFFESSFLFVSFIDKFMKVKRISILSLLE